MHFIQIECEINFCSAEGKWKNNIIIREICLVCSLNSVIMTEIEYKSNILHLVHHYYRHGWWFWFVIEKKGQVPFHCTQRFLIIPYSSCHISISLFGRFDAYMCSRKWLFRHARVACEICWSVSLPTHQVLGEGGEKSGYFTKATLRETWQHLFRLMIRHPKCDHF